MKRQDRVYEVGLIRIIKNSIIDWFKTILYDDFKNTIWQGLQQGQESFKISSIEKLLCILNVFVVFCTC